MISILIPTYNYNVAPLAMQLQQQCSRAGIVYEIIVLDDASTDASVIAQNNTINSLQNSSYTVLEKNIGRSAIRNLLAKKAEYDWMLFLDADTLPVSDKLISNYLPHLNSDIKVVYGGIRYQDEKPHQNELLRWIYGNEREALPVEERNKLPHLSMLTLNFLAHKKVLSVSFNENIPNLRYEDTLFSWDLKKAGIIVQHIDNPVYHNGLETSAVFLRKSEEALAGLKYLIEHNLIDPTYIRIAKAFNTIKKYRMLPLARLTHLATATAFKKNLLGPNPNLLIFDLYRLGYLCSLK